MKLDEIERPDEMDELPEEEEEKMEVKTETIEEK